MRKNAASQASVNAPAQQVQWLGTSGEGPRPNSEFIVSQPTSSATRIASFQFRTAVSRSASIGLAQRYIGSSEASCTP